ncbi:ATP-NAD kinase, partial [Ramicandelaber brevisporus]
MKTATPTLTLVQTQASFREAVRWLTKLRFRLHSVRSVMLITKPGDAKLVGLTREMALWLMYAPFESTRQSSFAGNGSRGIIVYVDEALRDNPRFGLSKILAEHPRAADQLRFWNADLCRNKPEQFEMVFTLGGDGTVLFASWLFQTIVPITIPFHLGSLGFLTMFEYANFRERLMDMSQNGVRVSLRMRFSCTVYRWLGRNNGKYERLQTIMVLNEVVVDRGPSPYMSSLELFGDGRHLTTVQADGLCVATPTGSTAYSLSAGGPLVHPDVPAIAITPICPHTLSFRPMLLPDTMALRVCVPRRSRSTAWASFDGRNRIELRRGDNILIKASQYPFPTVVGAGSQTADWFGSLSRCLHWNERKSQKSFD